MNSVSFLGSHSKLSSLRPCILDDPKVFEGAPVCLQLVTRTLEEEAAIALTEIVDCALKNEKVN